jgi:hypothetical protein
MRFAIGTILRGIFTMSTDRLATLFLAYILGSLACAAVVLGSVHRGTMPIYVWDYIGKHSYDSVGERVLDFAVSCGMYAVVYSTFFVYPYAVLRAMYRSAPAGEVKIVAFWIMATLILFYDQIGAALSAFFPDDTFERKTIWSMLREWLMVLWLPFTIFAIWVWRQMVAAKYKAKCEEEYKRGIGH